MPLVNKTYRLEKFPGKSGWTYALIPEVLQNKKNPFGWVKVKGSIDGIEFNKYHLMPYNGQLFLPVKSEIRKKIKKGVGDDIHVILSRDDEPVEVPEELSLCLQAEPKAFQFFNSLGEAEQSNYIKWIYSAKFEETKVERIAAAINKLMKGETVLK